MFSKNITESDEFLSMGTDVQNLYFHLGMQADDDGFVSPKRVMRMIGSASDSITHLVARGFVIPFEERVVVIRDWKENNYLRNDRYKPTQYKKELASLIMEDGRYTIGIPLVDAGKDRLGKDINTKTSKEVLPLEVVLDKPLKTRREPLNKEVLALREQCYDLLEEEWGTRNTPNQGDYFSLIRALKKLDEAQIKEVVEDGLSRKNPIRTLREALTDRNVDMYLQDN